MNRVGWCDKVQVYADAVSVAVLVRSCALEGCSSRLESCPLYLEIVVGRTNNVHFGSLSDQSVSDYSVSLESSFHFCILAENNSKSMKSRAVARHFVPQFPPLRKKWIPLDFPRIKKNPGFLIQKYLCTISLYQIQAGCQMKTAKCCQANIAVLEITIATIQMTVYTQPFMLPCR